jgi:lipid A disaccharide synthetase
VYPEFIQGAATSANISKAALDLLDHPSRRTQIKADLEKLMSSLGSSGASCRAAQAVASLLNQQSSA